MSHRRRYGFQTAVRAGIGSRAYASGSTLGGHHSRHHHAMVFAVSAAACRNRVASRSRRQRGQGSPGNYAQNEARNQSLHGTRLGLTSIRQTWPSNQSGLRCISPSCHRVGNLGTLDGSSSHLGCDIYIAQRYAAGVLHIVLCPWRAIQGGVSFDREGRAVGKDHLAFSLQYE